MASSRFGFRFLWGPEKEKASRARGVVRYAKSLLEWQGACQEESEWHGGKSKTQVHESSLLPPARECCVVSCHGMIFFTLPSIQVNAQDPQFIKIITGFLA